MVKPYDETEALRIIIKDQFSRHTDIQPQDLYKLIHQATCGGNHLLDNLKTAKAALAEEWATLDKVQKGEALLEPIDPKGEILRVNLRILRKIGGSMDTLFDVFVKSAKSFQRDETRLGNYWQIVLNMADKDIPLSRPALEDYFIEMGRKNFPPAHHSKSYLEANLPAYRIVMKQFWEGFNAE